MAIASRVLEMIVAYVAASVTAGVTLVAAMIWTPESNIGPIDLDFLHTTALFIGMVSTFVAALAFLPAVAVSWYAERRSKRSPLFYAAAGAAIGVLAFGIYVALLVWTDDSAERFSSAANMRSAAIVIAIAAAAVAIAGIAGGLTYWAIAGRKAGWKPVVPVGT